MTNSHTAPLAAAPPDRGAALRQWLAREWLLCIALGLVAVLAVVDPQPWARQQRWLDLPALASLFALLASTQAVRASGCVQRGAEWLAGRVGSPRALALVLVAGAALASMVLTNDVSLFLVVPLTLAMAGRRAGGQPLPLARLVIFEALAVNAGSMLSPIGNPQNLLVWQRSGADAATFVDWLLPAFGVGLCCLLVLTALSFSGTRFDAPANTPDRSAQPPRDRRGGAASAGGAAGVSDGTPLQPRLAVTAALLLAGSVWLMQAGRPGLAAATVALVLLVGAPQALRTLDWPLLATFAALFAGLGHLAAWPPAQQLAQRLDWADPRVLYGGGVLLSQAISNVPATVFLLHFTDHWPLLAVAANVGGYGLAIGSMANLIALRLEGSRRIWLSFHLWSLPFLAVVALLTAAVTL